MPQMLQVSREHAIGMLTVGMSTRAVARELNVHFSTISHLQRRFKPVRWMDYLGNGEVLTNTDLDRFVNNI